MPEHKNLRETFSSNITSLYWNSSWSQVVAQDQTKTHLSLIYRNSINLLNSNAAVYDRVEETGCSIHEKFAFILHGWRQDCDKTDWVIQLRESKYVCCQIIYDYVQITIYLRPIEHKAAKYLVGKIDFVQSEKLSGESDFCFGTL